MTERCLACELTSGDRPLPGGRIHATGAWVVEHCVGPLGVGTLLVKPFRHCTGVADLTAQEAGELGPLLRSVSACVQELNRADQVYVCLWSHAGWTPVHVHFVVQPAWQHQSASFTAPGPTLQSEMFRANQPPDPGEVAAFCDRARAFFAPRGPELRTRAPRGW
jgi:diadenosine tetraphosphate (Ap4A) HIT family hydrolase